MGMVTVTEKAKQRILDILAKENYDDTYFIRVAVESGGCSGLSYRLDFDNEEKKGDQLLKIRASKYASTLNHTCIWQVPSWTIRMVSMAKALSSTTPMHRAPALAEKVSRCSG